MTTPLFIRSSKAKLPQRVSDFISVDKRSLSPATVAAMSKADVAALKDIVGKRTVLEGPFRFDKAIAALAMKEQSPEVCALLKAVVADKAEPAGIRAVAAAKLVLMPEKEAEGALVANLGVADPLVKAKVMKSLGCIGGKTALARLKTLREPAEAFVKKQWLFAKTLIAYRLDLDEEHLPFMKGKERTAGKDADLVKLSLRRLNRRAVGTALQRFPGCRYGIDVSEQSGFELTAGRSRWALFLNRELQGLGIFANIKKRKFITGLLSLYDKRTDSYSVQYVVLSNPANKAVEIMLVRPDGEVFYSGKADASDGIMNFRIQDIDRPGTAPTTVKGRLTLKGVMLDVCIPFGHRKGKQRPRPLDMSLFRAAAG
jgi:hypothetical protein